MSYYSPNSPTSSDGGATDSERNATFGASGTAVAETSTYCAFSTNRSAAARRRNYDNCSQCKNARQGCTRSDGGACDRCKRLKKPCSLLSVIPSGSSSTPRRIPTMDEDERLFGRVVYRSQCDGTGLIEVVYVKVGNNGVEQAFRSRCDQNGVPVAPREYLGPWAVYSMKLKESSQSVDIDAMWEVYASSTKQMARKE